MLLKTDLFKHTWVPFSVAMTLLRRAGLSNPSPDLSLEAARDVGADGFCLQGAKV